MNVFVLRCTRRCNIRVAEMLQFQILLALKPLERAKGIEPSYRAWEALVLPLNYARFEMRKAL